LGDLAFEEWGDIDGINSRAAELLGNYCIMAASQHEADARLIRG
jgi:hypothetical protein